MHTIAPLAFCALAAIGLSFVADRIVDTAEELRARCLATLWGGLVWAVDSAGDGPGPRHLGVDWLS